MRARMPAWCEDWGLNTPGYPIRRHVLLPWWSDTKPSPAIARMLKRLPPNVLT